MGAAGITRALLPQVLVLVPVAHPRVELAWALRVSASVLALQRLQLLDRTARLEQPLSDGNFPTRPRLGLQAPAAVVLLQRLLLLLRLQKRRISCSYLDSDSPALLAAAGCLCAASAACAVQRPSTNRAWQPCTDRCGSTRTS